MQTRSSPYHVDVIKCTVSYVFAVYEFFVLEKTTIMLLERDKPVIKTLRKDVSKPYECGSSVKVNGISDGTLWNFMWRNAANVYGTKKKLPSISS